MPRQASTHHWATKSVWCAVLKRNWYKSKDHESSCKLKEGIRSAINFVSNLNIYHPFFSLSLFHSHQIDSPTALSYCVELWNFAVSEAADETGPHWGVFLSVSAANKRQRNGEKIKPKFYLQEYAKQRKGRSTILGWIQQTHIYIQWRQPRRWRRWESNNLILFHRLVFLWILYVE